MEITKRSIPRIASAGLLLGGGCSSSSGGANPNDVAFEFCQTLNVCGYVEAAGGVAYYEDYASDAECRSVVSNDDAANANGLDAAYGLACGDAFLDFYECYWDVYADYCDPIDAGSVCGALYDDFAFFCR